jgi:hemerythrin
MPLITWDTSYSVSVQRCDEQHQKLFSLLNALHDAMSVGRGRSVVGPIVQELAQYTQTHFQAEEALLQQTNYPALPTHLAEHKKFIDQVAKFQQDIDAGLTSNSIAIVTFLKNWLSTHIKQTDRQYGPHLNAKGIH